MTRPTIDSMSPFFIVNAVDRSIAFYRDRLGFTVAHQEPAAPGKQPFFAILNGLRGFEITDPDGYVLFFGRPK